MEDKFYRVNPCSTELIDEMDSTKPHIFSLKYREHIQNVGFSDEDLLKNNLKRVFVENLLEAVREQKYPDKPSRLCSIFLFDSLDIAEKFKDSGWTEPDGIISSYRILELYKPVFRADMGFVNMVSNLHEKWDEFKVKKAVFIKSDLNESLRAVCDLYWRGKTILDIGFPVKNHIPEILVEGKVQRIP